MARNFAKVSPAGIPLSKSGRLSLTLQTTFLAGFLGLNPKMFFSGGGEGFVVFCLLGGSRWTNGHDGGSVNESDEIVFSMTSYSINILCLKTPCQFEDKYLQMFSSVCRRYRRS